MHCDCRGLRVTLHCHAKEKRLACADILDGSGIRKFLIHVREVLHIRMSSTSININDAEYRLAVHNTSTLDVGALVRSQLLVALVS